MNDASPEDGVQIPADDDALMDEHVTAKASGQSVSKLRNDRYLRKGIPYIKLGSCVRYRVGDYREHIRQQRVETGAT